MNGIDDSWGTAVNVQSMVFGNMGETSGTGVAFTTLVSAEMVAAVSGIGWVILDASNTLSSDYVFVGIIIIGIAAILIDKILKLIENKVVFWKGQA